MAPTDANPTPPTVPLSVVIVACARASLPRSYIFRLGILDSSRGLMFTVLTVFYIYLKWIKLWQLQRGHGREQRQSAGKTSGDESSGGDRA